MPQARIWTEPADMTIVAMRNDGATWEAIGRALGLSRNTIIERGRRLRAVAPARAITRPQAAEPVVLDDPYRPPLPAGHPITWGLLSDQPYPERNAT